MMHYGQNSSITAQHGPIEVIIPMSLLKGSRAEFFFFFEHNIIHISAWVCPVIMRLGFQNSFHANAFTKCLQFHWLYTKFTEFMSKGSTLS